MNITRYLVGAGVLLSFCTTPAFATLIDFDDLPADYQLMPPWSYDLPSDMWETDHSVWTSRPLTDQYVDLGVSFGTGDLNEIAASQSSESGAGLVTRDDVVVSGPNAVGSHYTYDGLRFSFVGDERPQYLSLYVSAPSGAMSVTVNETGGTRQLLNLGYSYEDGEFQYTERPMKHKVEFFSHGIESVRLGNFYGHRTTPVYMDDLYFGAAPVSAPASLPVLVAGLAGLLVVRRARRKPFNTL